MKKCINCGDVKTLSGFYKNKGMRDGHLNSCKKCHVVQTKIHYRLNRKAISDKRKESNKTPENRAKNIEVTRKQRVNNPEKYKAHKSVSNAVQRGKLTKGPCESCGDINVQGHHEDYSKPLDVVWLCRRCHLHVHGKVLP